MRETAPPPVSFLAAGLFSYRRWRCVRAVSRGIVCVMDDNVNENGRMVRESLACVNQRWEPLIADACYGWRAERPREEAGVRDRAYIVSHRCTRYSYRLAEMIPGADIVEHGDLSVSVNGVRVPPGGAVTWTERRDVNAPYWESPSEVWNVQTWTHEQVLEIVSRRVEREYGLRTVVAPGVYTVAGNMGDAQQSLCSLSGEVQSVLCSLGVLAVSTIIPSSDGPEPEPLDVLALFAGGEYCGFLAWEYGDGVLVRIGVDTVSVRIVDDEELNDIACSIEAVGTADENEVAACVIGERDQWENNTQRIKAALAVEGADGDVRVTQEGVSLNGVSAKPGEALVWETWGDQVSHVHVADNDVVRLSMEEYERTDYPGVSLVRLYDNTEK